MVPSRTPAHALAGAPVSVAQFACDTREPRLAVDRMAVDADKIDNNGVNKWKAIVVLHTRKGHLWALGSKCGPPGALPVVAAAAGGEATDGAGDEIGSTDCNGGGACAPRPCAPREPVDNAPTVMQGGTANVEEIEKLTPEGTVPVFHSSARCAPISPPNDPCHSPKFCIFDAHDRPVHGTRPPRAQILTDRYHPHRHQVLRVRVALCLFARVGKGGPTQAEGRPAGCAGYRGVPTHADVVVHQHHRTIGEEDERRRQAEQREARQAAEAANAGKAITVTELWKPHLDTPLFKDLGHDITSLYPH
ncbi:hypothetical protein H4582DRAFT_389552 [Lactarius indigo]|nr:hypothetical protein H4582DRAFT_389552 [Lactarius indigo]